MSGTKDLPDPTLDEHFPPVEEHFIMPADVDAHIQAETRKTLEKMAEGEMAYHDLDDVMREYGFHAH